MDNNKMVEAPEKISRREALKKMALGSAGLVMGASLLSSCKGSAKAAPAEFTYTPAPDGSKITSRHWERSGDTIGLLGLGCMRLPQVEGSRNLDQEHVDRMVDYALAHGVNYFDTAPAYGQSEVVMGKSLSRYPRESYLLATKMSNLAFGNMVPTLEAAQQMFERSLSNLQTDYFDYFLLHNINSVSNFENRFIANGVLDYLLEQKRAGKIRNLGFSYHGNNSDFEKMLDYGVYDWDFVQIQMNYLDWEEMPNMYGVPGDTSKTDAKTLYELAEEREIPITVMEPIRGGALANVNEGLRAKMASRFPDLSPAGVALSFVGSYPNIQCVLSGMSNMEQLTENIATFTDFEEFDDEDKAFMMEVAELHRENDSIPCTACEYCMPCPHGVNIPAIFAVYNECSSELNLPNPDGEHDKEYKAKRRIFLNRYNKGIEKGARADACTECNACQPKCPQRIPITRQMQRINDLVAKLNN